jgi:hypothetical protein
MREAEPWLAALGTQLRDQIKGKLAAFILPVDDATFPVVSLVFVAVGAILVVVGMASAIKLGA